MDFLNNFEVYLEKEKRVSKTTLNAYMSDVSEFQDFLAGRGKKLDKAGNADVAAYMMDLSHSDKSASTINRKISSVRIFYSFMLSEGRMRLNPAIGIKAPRAEKKALEYLTEEEILSLINAPGNDARGLRDKALFEVMYATGLKANELCSIKVSDVDFRIGYINVVSGPKPRVVPIGKPARAALKEYLMKGRSILLGEKTSDALFLSYLGEELTRQGIWKILKQYSDVTGLGNKITPQIIRNTFAVHLIQNGADLKSLQELLGLEDINATKIYLAVSKTRIIDVYDKAFPRAK